jgi:ankyrin repeat protein
LTKDSTRDLNSVDSQGYSLLEFSHNDVNVNVKNNKNDTALHYASREQNIAVELFRLILENTTDVNAQNEKRETALHCAFLYKSETAVKELLNHKDVDVNIKNKDNRTSLYLVLQRWVDIPVDLFNLIREKSDDINAQDKDGNTPLHYAIVFQCENATKELHNKVDVNIKNDSKRTALHLVSKCWKDIPSNLFKKILEKSTDVINAKDRKGSTALHCAILNESQICGRRTAQRRSRERSSEK